MQEDINKQLERYDVNHKHTVRADKSLTITDEDDTMLLHGAMGLCTEAAEVLDLFKKKYYGKKVPYTKEKLMDELGDVFWYFWELIKLLKKYGITFVDVLRYNNKKLEERYKHG